MDDIYDNLENYNDFNKINELQNENKELKYRIEEYTSAIDKLQKDFDKLADEHKKLEINYSALLKTAKAEIERKTHMIQELNMEKDKLVISARQNQHRNSFNKFKSDKQKSKNDRNSDTNSLCGQEEHVEITKQTSKKPQKINTQLQLANLLNPCNDHDRNVVIEAENNSRNNTNSEDRSFISKENDMQLLNKLSNRHTETVLKKITNRRKSMPVLSNEMKFSSDDECENSAIKEENTMLYKSRDEPIKRLVERNSYNNKKSETSSTENNHPLHQEFSQGNYSKNKSNWYCNNDRYRTRDQYLSSQRQRWNLSPDTSYHRRGREYMNDYYHKYDYNHRRAYDSPPSDKWYHQSRSRDRRSIYSRDYSRDMFRNRNGNERYAEKHKLHIDIEEPSCKRQKFDYNYRHVDDRRQKEIEFSKAPLPTSLEQTEHFSCQSPDFAHSDYFTFAPIKEIRSTACMQLEDPRISSGKYKIINDNNKEVLSTVIGRNLEILTMDKNIWGFKPVPMPKALLEPPSDDAVKLDKHNNAEIEKQISNVSVESGELSDLSSYSQQLQSNNLSDHLINYDNDNKVITSKTKENSENEVEMFTQNCQNNIDDKKSSTQAVKENNVNKICLKPISSSYRIPKLKNNSDVLSSNIKNIDNNKKSCNDIGNVGTNIAILLDTSKSSLENKSMPQLISHSKHFESRNNDIATKIVEADLVLSDDPSDDIEPHTKVLNKEIKTICNRNRIEEHSGKKTIKYELKKCTNPTKVLTETAKVVENKEKQSSVDKDKNKLIETSMERHKKVKARKKALEGKISDKDTLKQSKIKKTKKDSKTEEVKSKFSDLFGDSSSLITPDDLGIMSEPKTKEKFVTISENTQDAVDLNFKEMEDVLINNPQNSFKDQKLITHSSCTYIKENNCDDDNLETNKISKENIHTFDETKTSCNTYENVNSEKPESIKTIIISTGRQSQCIPLMDNDHTDLNVASVGKVDKPIENLVLKALATSTPAKPFYQEQTYDDSLPTDNSISNSTNSRAVDLSLKVDQLSDRDTQKDTDVPDVRIFVKRRRKAKK